jgi:hypothetical protein
LITFELEASQKLLALNQIKYVNKFSPMRHFRDEWINEWCQQNGWTDLVIERQANYWAFPPNAVMPEPIPAKILREIKIEKGMSREEKTLAMLTLAIALIAVIFSCGSHCPFPLVLAFAFAAIALPQFEVEGI